MRDIPVTGGAPHQAHHTVRGLNIEVNVVVDARLQIAAGLVGYGGAHPVALPDVI